MGQEESSQEKTEEATPRKLRDARKKGQVAKSKDLNSIVLLLVAFLALAILNHSIGKRLGDFMVACFGRINQGNFGPQSEGNLLYLFPLLNESIEIMAIILGPLLAIVFIVAFLISYVQVGGAFSIEPIKPSWKKINPVEGFKRIFKLRSLIELIKSAVKILVVFFLAYWVIRGRMDDLILSVTAGILPTLILAGQIMTSFIVKVCVFFFIISLFDLLYQRWQYLKDLRMTKYELMQEFKRDEGDPLLKSHRRQIHQELNNMDMSKVKKSDVVVVNPVHLAIAIQYDRANMIAPEIAVKGQRLVAEQIKNIAQENHIPIVENVPLAHALFELEPGDEIPEELYEAMAEILSFVYRLRTQRFIPAEPM